MKDRPDRLAVPRSAAAPVGSPAEEREVMSRRSNAKQKVAELK
jgi:hypothetical protein